MLFGAPLDSVSPGTAEVGGQWVLEALGRVTVWILAPALPLTHSDVLSKSSSCQVSASLPVKWGR